MDYKIVVTAEAEEDLNQFIQYLLFAKKNKQAAKNVLDDFENTIKKLKYVASSLKVCDNPRLQSLGYRRINFQQHLCGLGEKFRRIAVHVHLSHITIHAFLFHFIKEIVCGLTVNGCKNIGMESTMAEHIIYKCIVAVFRIFHL